MKGYAKFTGTMKYKTQNFHIHQVNGQDMSSGCKRHGWTTKSLLRAWLKRPLSRGKQRAGSETKELQEGVSILWSVMEQNL